MCIYYIKRIKILKNYNLFYLREWENKTFINTHSFDI